MLKHKIILAGFTTFVLSGSLFAVELYKWTDEYGRVYYTDKPPPEENVEKLDIKIRSFEGEPQVFDAKGKLNSNSSVVMYSAEWCGICKRAKKYLQKNNITFKEMDIDKSSQARREFKKLNGKGVPIILVGKQRMNGFSAAKLEDMLKKSKDES
jgi:glutaredoxin-like YruB-family protein